MDSNFKPWEISPSLRLDRLRVVAGIIQRVWAELSDLHEPSKGDTGWTIGCRGYGRICHEISRGATGEHREWLTVLRDTGLSYLFAIGDVPFKFLRGHPDRTVVRHRICRKAEADARQSLLFSTPDPEIASLLPRLVVETDGLWRAQRVVLVWLDRHGLPHHPFEIPLDAAVLQPVPPAPVQLPPAVLGFERRQKKDLNQE